MTTTDQPRTEAAYRGPSAQQRLVAERVAARSSRTRGSRTGGSLTGDSLTGDPGTRRFGIRGSGADRPFRPDLLTAGLIVLCWATTIVPPLIQSLTAPKYRMSVGEEAPRTALSSAATAFFGLGLIGLCLVVVVLSVRRLPTTRYGLLTAALLPWFYQAGRDMFSAEPPGITGLTYPLIVLAVFLLQPRMDQLITLGGLVLLTAVTSLAMGLLLPEKGILRRVAGDAVSPEKQIFSWGILVGPFSSGNNLGQFLVLGLPIAMLIRGVRARAAIVAVIVLTVVWTSSRTSLGAIVVGGAMAAAVLLVPPALRRLVAWAGMLGTLALLMTLPLVTTDPFAFTNRGLIWRASFERWREDPWFGLGSRFYSQAAQYANNIAETAFHGHNQLVQFTVIGGLLNLAVLAVFLAAVTAAAARRAAQGSPMSAVFVTMLFLCGTLEVAFAFVHRSYTQPVTLLPMAFILFARDADEDPTPDSTEGADGTDTPDSTGTGTGTAS